MAETMGLSSLDLVSKLTSYISLGCSIWYAMPQIFLNYMQKPPTDGPSFSLLILWLVGDIAQVAAMFIENTLFTQKFSGIWFGATDVVIMLQLSYYRGWWPGTQNWHNRKAKLLVHRHRQREHEREGRLRNDKTWKGKMYRLLSSPWLDFNGKRLNGVIFFLIVFASFLCWFFLNFQQRETATPPTPTKRPHDGATWAGWYTGMAGLLFYQVPRAWQICKILKKGMKAISVWLFAFLVGQNATLAVSILTVNLDADSRFGQLPFLINTFVALFFDLCVLALDRWGKKAPPEPADSVYGEGDGAQESRLEVGPPAVVSVARRSEELASSARSIASPHQIRTNSMSTVRSRRPSTRTSGSHGDRSASQGVVHSSRSRSSNAGRASASSHRPRPSLSSSDDGMEHSPEENEWARWQQHLGGSETAHGGASNSNKRGSSHSHDLADATFSLEKRDRRPCRLPSFSSSESSDAVGGSSSDDNQHLPLRSRGQVPIGKQAYNPRRGVGTRWT
ncbi:hypothetical protein JCM6882_003974 [Rhodosporidiobolus microsporus]